jgi:hypothetical protein
MGYLLRIQQSGQLIIMDIGSILWILVEKTYAYTGFQG